MHQLKRSVRLTAILGLVVVLTPVWAVHHAVSSLRSRGRHGRTRSIRRVSASGADLASVMASGEPVIIAGLLDELGLRRAAGLEWLQDVAGRVPTEFDVEFRRIDAPYYLYTGDYGAVVERVEEMALDDFIDRVLVDDGGEQTCAYQLFTPDELGGEVDAALDVIYERLDPLVEHEPERSASGIWVGSTGVVTPLHHDAWTGLLLQMTGSKRVLMFPPSERPNLSFVSPFRAEDRWSRLPGRCDDADPHAFPRLASAQRFEGRLDEGDVLFIPPFWSHEIEGLSPSVSVPLRFRTRRVDMLNPGFLRPAWEGYVRARAETSQR